MAEVDCSIFNICSLKQITRRKGPKKVYDGRVVFFCFFKTRGGLSWDGTVKSLSFPCDSKNKYTKK